ncbi:MAG: T9SS type A sorting domain-containing protein [Salibacter sp.]|uniref:T9SS type A sorting domain-containing protein n=1 Tax=Salibacter sp. TaxID=2010995 RepID=UPI00286FEF10|nr:T9SS type A sorting domain-containing protein [Salibacter sp.]MDR9397603.1 T9SS type A sorting domain-containing protein [Salibacter sp.]
MKSYLLTIFSFIITAGLFSQQTHFPDSNAIWSVWQTKYKVEGDSTYNGKTYQKYFSAQDISIDANTEWSYVGMVREDTNAQKVYAIHPDSTQEHLLYDFDVSVGDTVAVYQLIFLTQKVEVIIESVDTLMINNIVHKRVKTESDFPYDEYWLEGIGSTYGVLSPGSSNYPVSDVSYPQLLCFERDGVKLFERQSFENCYAKDPNVSVDEVRNDVSVKVFPNPTSNQLRIQSDLKISSFKVLSVTGQVLKAGMLSDQVISVNALNAGVYFLEITTQEGEKGVERFVVE